MFVSVLRERTVFGLGSVPELTQFRYTGIIVFVGPLSSTRTHLGRSGRRVVLDNSHCPCLVISLARQRFRDDQNAFFVLKNKPSLQRLGFFLPAEHNLMRLCPLQVINVAAGVGPVNRIDMTFVSVAYNSV